MIATTFAQVKSKYGVSLKKGMTARVDLVGPYRDNFFVVVVSVSNNGFINTRTQRGSLVRIPPDADWVTWGVKL